MRLGRWFIPLMGLMLCLSAAPVMAMGQWPVNASGFPDVSGDWMEGSNLVRISQTGGNLVATCTYGNISWRMEGTITREGAVTGRLVHTAGVSQSATGFAQDRRMVLSADGRALQGQSTFVGGGHPLNWKRSSPLPTTTSGTSQATGSWVTNSSGYPDISGDWVEGSNLVRISQTSTNLVATCAYGNISWRMEGTITRDGMVAGRLVHTAGVASSSNGYAQDRRLTLSADGRVLEGRATFVGGGGHALTWKRTLSSPPPPPPPPPIADRFTGDWLGAFHCSDPAGQMSTFNLVIWRENGQLLWTDWSVAAISPAVFTEETTRYKLVTSGWDDRGRKLSYTWYIDKKGTQPLMYGESQFEAYPSCGRFRYMGLTRWANCPAGSAAPSRKPIVK